LVYGWIAGFFVGLPHMKLHSHWHRNWTGLIHSKLRNNRLNVAVLMSVDRVMLPMTFHVHAEIDGETPEVMHPEPLLHLSLDLPDQALFRNAEEIIDVPNDHDNDYV
jgi:hypothetical protein